MTPLEQNKIGLLYKVVANYEWYPVDGNRFAFATNVKIKVLEHPDGSFVARASHGVRIGTQETVYSSLENEASVEGAVRSCIMSLLSAMGTVDNTIWPKNDYF